MPNTRTTIRTEITEWVVKVQKKLLVIGAEHQDARADLAVSELLEGQTRSGVQKLMLAGAVLCGLVVNQVGGRLLESRLFSGKGRRSGSG